MTDLADLTDSDDLCDMPEPPGLANMTPAELASARHRLDLSQEQLASLGEPFGARVAASGRTVRRWESGTRTIPGPVAILIQLALASPEVRRILGLTPWEGDGHGA
jgi:DNA-binding transcriptional regulator YiaG